MEEEGEDETAESEKTSASSNVTPSTHIPLEIVSEDEMALIEAALSAAAARTISSSSPFLAASRNLKRTISFPSQQRALACCSDTKTPPREDVEDLGHPQIKKEKKSGGLSSLYLKFRSRRGLSVTDITQSVSCSSPFYSPFPFFVDFTARDLARVRYHLSFDKYIYFNRCDLLAAEGILYF